MFKVDTIISPIWVFCLAFGVLSGPAWAADAIKPKEDSTPQEAVPSSSRNPFDPPKIEAPKPTADQKQPQNEDTENPSPILFLGPKKITDRDIIQASRFVGYINGRSVYINEESRCSFLVKDGKIENSRCREIVLHRLEDNVNNLSITDGIMATKKGNQP